MSLFKHQKSCTRKRAHFCRDFEQFSRSPEEVFRQAIRRSAAGVICFHNHPSGDPSPSVEDIQVTERLFRAGRIVGIELIDHIIIGDGVFFSMRENEYLPGEPRE